MMKNPGSGCHSRAGGPVKGKRMAIDREADRPLYYQLKQLLIQQIEQGTYQPGDMLPTEEQLEEMYGLSRTTIRHALRELELEGRVTRTRGRGTFVARSIVVRRPGMSYRPLNRYREDALNLSWQVLSMKWVRALPEIGERLQIDRKSRVFQLRRLHLVDGEPIGYHLSYVSPHFSQAIDMSALDRGGPMTYLEGGGFLEGSTASRIIEAVPAGPRDRMLLKVAEGTPLMRIRRLVVSRDGRPVEDLLALYLGNRFQYRIDNLPAIIPPDADSDSEQLQP